MHAVKYSLQLEDYESVMCGTEQAALSYAGPEVDVATVVVWTTSDGRRYKPSARRTCVRDGNGSWRQLV